MPVTGQLYYPTKVASDVTYGNVIYRLETAANTGPSNEISTAAHPNAAGTTEITFIPYASTSVTGSRASLYGWVIPIADPRGMSSEVNAQRIIPAGTWSFNAAINIPQGATGGGTHTVTVRWTVYRITASGIVSTIANVLSAAQVGSSLQNTSVVATGAEFLQQVTFGPGESLHVAINTINQQSANVLGATTAGNVFMQHGTANSTYVTLPAPGVRTLYGKQQSDFAPATEANDRKLLLPRQVSEAILVESTAVRGFTGGRTLAESPDLPPEPYPLDRKLTFMRDAAEEIGTVDGGANRELQLQRANLESLPTAGTMAISFSGARSISESIPTVSELARAQTLARSFAGTTSTEATLERQALLNRTMPETVSGTGVAARALVLIRTQLESIPTSASVQRLITYVRDVTENLTQGGGGIVKKIIQVFDD